ncbi:MAG: hypothetical protein JXB38_12365 [Anaerolineales bacterium]|nr:hypothetical protein [Anaerolineales bacterium]
MPNQVFTSPDGNIQVQISTVQFSLTPGQRINIPLVLVNQGEEEDVLKISVEGVPQHWVTLPPAAHLLPGYQHEAYLAVHPPRSPDTKPGHDMMVVSVESLRIPPQHDPTQKSPTARDETVASDRSQQNVLIEIHVSLDVAAYHAYTSHIHPKQIKGDESIRVHIHNTSNIPELYTIRGFDVNKQLVILPSQTQLRVEPNQRAYIDFHMHLRWKRLFGRPFFQRFTVQVQSSTGDVLEHQGRVLDEPQVPTWAAVILFGVLGMLVLAISFLFFQWVLPDSPLNISGPAFATSTGAEVDSDGDGLPDADELRYGTDPNNRDSDGDLISDYDELVLGLSPLNADSDGDGLNDGDEIRYNTNPLLADTDNDGLNDRLEVIEMLTDPNNPDTDGDGVIDGEDPSPTGEVTLTPSATVLPSATPTITQTPAPQDWVSFVDDVSIEDGTEILPGAVFEKIWRLENIGSRAWTTDYDLVFVRGNSMGAQTTLPLPEVVEPGESIELGVALRAPLEAGEYRGEWKLRNSEGTIFGTGDNAGSVFWVEIEVPEAEEDYIYDLAYHMCQADWFTASIDLICPGKASDENGFVLYSQRVDSEGGNQNAPAIRVHPGDEDSEWISGVFPIIEIGENQHFQATLGCIAEKPDCDVTFQLNYTIGNQAPQSLDQWTQVSDGTIVEIDVNLSSLADEEVRLILTVLNNGNLDDADVFWLAPRVVKVEATATP